MPYPNSPHCLILHQLLTVANLSGVESAFAENAASANNLPTYDALDGTAFVIWEYMYSTGSNQQDIYYRVDGGSQLSVEWLLNDQNDILTHFILAYNSISLGKAQFYCLTDGGTGNYSTIRIQGAAADGSK